MQHICLEKVSNFCMILLSIGMLQIMYANSHDSQRDLTQDLVAIDTEMQMQPNTDSKEYSPAQSDESSNRDRLNPAFYNGYRSGILFDNNYGDLGISYFNVFSLSDSQILGLNGVALDYEYLHTLKNNMQAKIYANLSLGSASSSLVTQDTNVQDFFLAFLLKADINIIPLGSSPISYLVAGLDSGFSSLTSLANFIIGAYVGVDFLYKNMVFRPFFKISNYILFTNITQPLGLYGDLGLRTFGYFKSGYVFVEASVRQDILRDTSNLVVVLPNVKALALSGVSTSIDANAGIEIINNRWLRIRGDIGVLYTLRYYNINTYVSLGAYIAF